MRKSENLRKEAGAGRADSGEPYRLTEGSKRSPERRLNLIWPEPAKVKSDSAGAEDGTPRPVDLRERSDLKKNPPYK